MVVPFVAEYVSFLAGERTLPRAYGIMLFFPIFTKKKKSKENEVVHALKDRRN